jgi:hypothetical protein
MLDEITQLARARRPWTSSISTWAITGERVGRNGHGAQPAGSAPWGPSTDRG